MGPAADDARHLPDRPDSNWNETWLLDFWDQSATLGGYAAFVARPRVGVCWFWAALIRRGGPLVAVHEHSARLPPPPELELRASGLWSELIVQTPLDHATVGLEAFGLAFDEPGEIYGRGWGDRVPLGFDLEWETTGPVEAGAGSQDMACRVTGEILVGADAIELDGWGHRRHTWGTDEWWRETRRWVVARLDDGSSLHADDLGQCRVLGGSSDAPVLVEPEGAAVRLDRRLGRVEAPDGRVGTGWLTVVDP